jgi:hypothetical protein
VEPFATMPSSGDAGKRAIVEIGPHDLPMPAGGWIELVLDDDPRPAELTAARERGDAGPIAPAATAPRTAAPLRPAAAPVRAGRRWLLLPEALVVAGFLLAGAVLAVALRVARAPASLASPATAALAAKPEVVPTPAELPRRRAGRAARASGALEVPPPVRASSPVDLAAPPEPSLAPWGGTAR